jgi:AcrR family transcriptional regulator
MATIRPVAEIPLRVQKAKETRSRIADAALDLFVARGFTETTIDEIAQAAGVGRRTVFRHFPTKEAILFDHLAVRRDWALERLRERPLSEPPLVSLHAVLRALCEQGYERRLLGQIRAVLAVDPRFAGEELSVGTRAFEHSLIATLETKLPDKRSPVQMQALTEMAEAWFLAAVKLYFRRGERSLVEYFDEVVATCAQACSLDLLGDRRVPAMSSLEAARPHR